MISSIINISNLNFDTPIQYASSVISIVALSIILIIIAIEISVISRHKGRYQEEEFKQRFGSIIEGLNTDSIIGRYWNLLNLFRWALTIVIMV